MKTTLFGTFEPLARRIGSVAKAAPVTKVLAWMVVGFCAMLVGVGMGVKEERAALGPAGGSSVYAQATDGASADGEAPSVDKGEAPAQLTSPMNDDGSGPQTSWFEKVVSFLGIFVLIALAFAMSNNRKKVNWKLVIVGTVLQLIFAIFIFYVPFGEDLFAGLSAGVNKLLDFTNEGSKFIFASYVTGDREPAHINFAFHVLPTIIFFSSFMTVLYHLGIMQVVVKGVAWVMFRAMGTSGAESLSAAANIFVGQTEAPLVVKPFIDRMTMSELMTVMTGGFATVAGGVLALYVGMLQPNFPDIAGHLIAASVMSAPAALVIGKVMYPEISEPETMGSLKMPVEKVDSNVIEAAARGAGEGLKLALNVAAMLLAFIALIALMNYVIGLPSFLWNAGELESLVAFYRETGLVVPEGCDGAANEKVLACIESMRGAAGAPAVSTWHVLTFQEILGVLFWPVAWVMGVPAADCSYIGSLLGTKMVLNELVAYSDLLTMLKDPEIQLQRRSVVIATYALCGFANFGSIAIQIGGLGGIAPSRRTDLAKLGLRAMIAGSIAAFMTATIAGILV